MSKSKTINSTGNQETPISKSNPAKAGSPDNQLTSFEKAMKLFHKREFQPALPLFDEAGKVPTFPSRTRPSCTRECVASGWKKIRRS